MHAYIRMLLDALTKLLAMFVCTRRRFPHWVPWVRHLLAHRILYCTNRFQNRLRLLLLSVKLF